MVAEAIAEKHYIVLGDNCPVCRTFSRISFPADRPPPLPLVGCSDPGGCRCSLPVPETKRKPVASERPQRQPSPVAHAAAAEADRQAEADAGPAVQSSLYDDETRLFTTEAFVAFAARTVAGAARRRGTLGVILLSLDGADEPASDNEQVADEQLPLVAGILRETARYCDIIGRDGPRRFAVIAHAVGESGAKRLAERIQTRLGRAMMGEQPGRSLTVSQGIAALQPGVSFSELLSQADQALAKAIDDGGNCFRVGRRSNREDADAGEGKAGSLSYPAQTASLLASLVRQTS